MTDQSSELSTATTRQVQGTAQSRPRETYSPRADIYESGNAIVVLADMPGVAQDAVDITLEKNVLTIQGHVETPERSGYRLAYGEYEDGDYERSFALSEVVDRDGIEATVRDGVLKLILPKARQAAARKIPVKAG